MDRGGAWWAPWRFPVRVCVISSTVCVIRRQRHPVKLGHSPIVRFEVLPLEQEVCRYFHFFEKGKNNCHGLIKIFGNGSPQKQQRTCKKIFFSEQMEDAENLEIEC